MEVKKGFKQTEIGVLPEDWDVVALGRMVRSVEYGSSSKSLASGAVPVIRMGNLQNGKIDWSDLVYTDTEAEIKRYSLRRGDVLFNRTNTIELVGKSSIYEGERPAIFAGYLIRINTLPGVLDTRYLNYILNTEMSRKHSAKVLSVAVGQANINGQKLKTYPVPMPPTMAEQEAIAGALSDADAWIESLEQLIAKKRQIKQGAMQELLTGKRRLPGFSGEWETKRLGEIGSTYGGLTGKAKSDFGTGNARYVTFLNVMSNVVVDCTTFEYVKVAASESQNRVIKGDILFNGSSETPEEVAMCAHVDADIENVYLNSFCFGFRFWQNGSFDGKFMAYYLRSNVGREVMKSLAQGSTRYNLSKTALLKARLQLPDTHEQTAIAIVLSDMDTEIESLKSRLSKAREIKQGMMQALLTGKIRINFPITNKGTKDE